MFKGKFGGLKLAIKKWLLLFGYELIRDKEGNNKLKKIYSSKPAVQFMKDYNKKDNLIVAEVGVWKGDTTKHIIKILPIKKIYAIDSWTTFDSGEHDIRTMNNAEKIARKRLDKYKDKVVIIKKYSKDAVKDIKEKLDFIYIDADHDYEPVKKDIELYYKLLHKGGVLSGDDIQNRKIPNGVGKALAEFAVKNNLDFFIEGNNWWIIKK